MDGSSPCIESIQYKHLCRPRLPCPMRYHETPEFHLAPKQLLITAWRGGPPGTGCEGGSSGTNFKAFSCQPQSSPVPPPPGAGLPAMLWAAQSATLHGRPRPPASPHFVETRAGLRVDGAARTPFPAPCGQKAGVAGGFASCRQEPTRENAAGGLPGSAKSTRNTALVRRKPGKGRFGGPIHPQPASCSWRRKFRGKQPQSTERIAGMCPS